MVEHKSLILIFTSCLSLIKGGGGGGGGGVTRQLCCEASRQCFAPSEFLGSVPRLGTKRRIFLDLDFAIDLNLLESVSA